MSDQIVAPNTRDLSVLATQIVAWLESRPRRVWTSPRSSTEHGAPQEGLVEQPDILCGGGGVP